VAVELLDGESGRSLGTVTEEQFQLLVDALEEESVADRDYYISSATIDMLAEDGADPALLALLRSALGSRDGAEIAWRRK
jgi:processive 1,2-diacylglycerol beta-glucosyltransferase